MTLTRRQRDHSPGIRHYAVQGPLGAVVAIVMHTEDFPPEITRKLTLRYPFVAFIDIHHPSPTSKGGHGPCDYLDGGYCRLSGWSPDPFSPEHAVLWDDMGEVKIFELLEAEYREAFKEA